MDQDKADDAIDSALRSMGVTENTIKLGREAQRRARGRDDEFVDDVQERRDTRDVRGSVATSRTTQLRETVSPGESLTEAQAASDSGGLAELALEIREAARSGHISMKDAAAALARVESASDRDLEKVLQSYFKSAGLSSEAAKFAVTGRK